jgi:integrase
MSLRLEEQFGLRREESIKIRPRQADQGDQLVLQASWTKGGRAREIPIRTPEQRAVLDEAKTLAGAGSLIPADMSYVEQLRRFAYQCKKAGIDHVHGLRHHYAQRRYFELTGQRCPAAGGPCSKQLTPDQKKLDREARLTISEELGHEREQITAIYLGR